MVDPRVIDCFEGSERNEIRTPSLASGGKRLIGHIATFLVIILSLLALYQIYKYIF